jgi:pimeloyl-ACP methyl ester carboxylesterase
MAKGPDVRNETGEMHIEYVEAGSGEAVVFIPGSYSTSAAWRPVQKLLPQRWRFVSTSLCGYGRTAETRTDADFAIAHEVGVVAQVARRAGGRVHLVGHSFGATVALACAVLGAVDVVSLSLFEANPMALLRGRLHLPLYEAAWQVAQDFAAAVHAGEADAPARIIDYWGGPDAFASLPAGVQDYCRATAPANVLDWRTDFGFDVTHEDCARLDVPVLLVRGGLANAAMVAMTDVLAASLRQASPAVVSGASHFLISTHAASCAELLGGFLARVACSSRG